METFGGWSLAIMFGLLAVIHPHAAAGAAFGCFFFLASPSSTGRIQRIWLGVFSFGIGYAAGVFAYGEGPPFSNKAMLVSGTVSALAAVIWTGLHRMAEGDKPLPQWLKDLLHMIPALRGKGSGDGS